MILRVDGCGDPGELPHALGHLQTELVECEVEQVGWLEVRTVDQIVSALRVLLEPRTLVGGVVQYDVTDTQHLSDKYVIGYSVTLSY